MIQQNDEDRLPEVDQQADPLDDLFNDAMLAQAMKNPKHKKAPDPSMRNALDATAKKMRDLYTLPENWERKRGIALIDKASQTLVGNFSEYIHKTVPRTRKLLREHQPIAIDATEVVEGYLGSNLEYRLKGISWERELEAVADLWFEEMMVGCPLVKLLVKSRLGAIIRIELVEATQFASHNGSCILQLPSGTNVQEQLSTDSKRAVRKACGL